MRPACVVGLVTVSLTAQSVPTEVTHVPGPIGLSWGSPGRWAYATRVLDRITGKPVAGAVLFLTPEREYQRGGDFWFAAKWVADADGFVRVPSDAPWQGLCSIDAEGHGPRAEFEHPPCAEVTLLMPGVDWPIVVRDAFDRPVAGAEVGLCLGCGHTPDVRVATTDASGQAWLRACDPTGFDGDGDGDLYVRADGLSPEHDSPHWWGSAPLTVLRPGFARSVRGRVRAPNGRPLPGVIAKSECGLHRGPSTWTDTDGSFVLLADASETVRFVLPDREFFGLAPASGGWDVVLPVEQEPEPAPAAPVRLAALDAATGAPIAGAEVRLWSTELRHRGASDAKSDGRTDAAGTYEGRLPAGRCSARVSAALSGGELSHDLGVLDFSVAAVGTTEIRVPLQRRVPLRVGCAETVDRLYLVTRTEVCDVLSLVEAGAPVPVPAQGPFAFRLEVEHERFHEERIVPFDAPPTGDVMLRPFPPSEVRVRVVDARGQPAQAAVALVELDHHHQWDEEPEEPGAVVASTDADGVVMTTTVRTGAACLRIRPVAAALRRGLVPVSLPARGDAVRFDAGTVVLADAAAPRLRVLDADGRPAAGECELLRPALRSIERLAPDGGFDGLPPRAGDRVTVHFDAEDEVTWAPGEAPVAAVSCSQELVGDGPWIVQRGGGALQLSVEDDGGMAVDAVVLLGAEAFPCRRRLALRGVPDTALELFVGAVGCDSARVRLRLAPHETRSVHVVLRRVP